MLIVAATLTWTMPATHHDGPVGDGIRARIASHGEGLWALSLSTPDLAVAYYGYNTGPNVPKALLDTAGEVKDSLWVYSGYLLPKVSGSYTFSFDADDYGRFYIGNGTQAKNVSSSTNDGDPKTLTFELKAGEVVPVWVFFKNHAPGDYWEDWASDIAKIAQTHITRITALVEKPDTTERAAFEAPVTK